MDNGSIPGFITLILGISVLTLLGTAVLTAWGVRRRRR